MTKLFRDGEPIHGCQGLEMVEGKRGVGATIKGQHEGGLCGDVIVLYPDCSGGYTPDKIAQNLTHTLCQCRFPGLHIT